MFDKRARAIASIAGPLVFIPVFAAGPSFVPDTTLKGGTLAGWHAIGQAEWRAENGELTGRAKPGGSGWLRLHRAYQDMALYASFRCAADCKADPYGRPVLYWYRTVRNPKAPGGAEVVPELIHNRSGVGSDVLAQDLNRDGAVDIVTSTNRGTMIFWGTPGARRRALMP